MKMKLRFMKLYRLFRLKKYGEPIGPPLPVSKRKQKLPLPPSEPLHAIHEEGESDHEEGKFDGDGFAADIRDNIFEDIIYEFILLHADSVVRVHSFLLMLIFRRRYLKMKEASKVI